MLAARIGLDIGSYDHAADRAAACKATGAAVARIGVGLDWRAGPDDELLAAVGEALDAVAAEGLEVVVMVDSDFTVAPDGLGAFRDPPGGSLAAAWEAEWRENLTLLAAAIGARVSAWELLPEPNRGSPARIAPVSWAHLVAIGARAVVDAAPGARVLPGGILCDGGPESEAYLTAALDGGLADFLAASAGSARGGGMALRLALAGDDGGAETDVAAACTATVEAHHGIMAERVAQRRSLSVTGLTWRADRCGESTQARNLWAAFNALSARPDVDLLVWSSLLDVRPGAGLFRGLRLDADDRRPAWQTFNDFALYARQIAPPAVPLDLGGRDAPAVPEAGPAATVIEEETVEDTNLITIRIPTAADVLGSQGLAGADLEGALGALREKYGEPAALGPGEYTVAVPGAGKAESPKGEPAAYTNQDVIGAFYRVGGGTWDVFERSGLSLGSLARARRDPYRGPPIDTMDTLSAEDRAAVLRELASWAGGGD